jgi:hypothetical protein
LRTHPLDDIANPRRITAVIRDGHYLPRAELAQRVAVLAPRYK